MGAFPGVLMVGLIKVGMDFLSIDTAWRKIAIGTRIVGAVVLRNISKIS